MRKAGEIVHLTASDLVGHLNCRYLTALDLAAAKGELAKPTVWDPVLEILAERGAQHEKAYVEHLASQGLPVTAIDGVGIEPSAVEKTLVAMKAGAPIIVQGALQSGRWSGRADVLLRVEIPSVLGPWSYEAVDTKLAKETKGGTVLQLSLYSDLLTSVQERVPEFSHVITPGTNYQPETYRTADYGAYYRRVRTSLEQSVNVGTATDVYPEPNIHCDICRWRHHCDAKRRNDDHMSLVAGISKMQIGELQRHEVTTTAKLAEVPLPWPWKPDRGSTQSYERVREQARMQVLGRNEGKVVHEALPVEPGFGLCSLPEPSPGDIFFDLEGDPFVSDGGLEFLFGYAYRDDKGQTQYHADWSFTRAEEKAAFERFVDFAIQRLEQYPSLHIYHFAPYEPAALKRLMGRYATRENEIDRLLRAGVFIDLYAVVRHAIRASVESYSIKKLELLYEFVRSQGLGEAGKTLAKVQTCLELGDVSGVTETDRTTVSGYNRDDCLSAWALRDWLEALRTEMLKSGANIPRPEPKSGDASEELNEWQKRIAGLIERLTHDVPVDVVERTPEQHARWLLAYILDWHRREEKAIWWEYFRLSALSAEDLLDERAALSGLTFAGEVGGTARAPIHRYTFPPQETELRGDEDLRALGGDRLGRVEAISLEERTLDIKKRQDSTKLHPVAVFAHTIVPSQVLAEALMRIGEYAADNGMAGNGPYQAARDLLMIDAPKIGGQPIKQAQETTLEAAVRIATALEPGVFPIQGPPGAGKTHTGARMICALVAAGKKVGITANSHKVIRNLLDDVQEACAESGQPIQCIQKVSEKTANIPGIRFTTDNAALFSSIGLSCPVAAGTAWLWARPEAFETVDVLFIDEAAQMSLANVLAVSHAAKTVVLLGDPRQLEQPIQGSHPEGIAVSALKHILGEHATVAADRGLFLEETWRLHPDICSFTSELFYEDRLRSRPGLEQQQIKSQSRIKGSGLRYLPVFHSGNQSSSPEEADAIKALVDRILASNATWVNGAGAEAAVTLEDILIIAPYNAQVFELQDRLPGARIGTVDKFQGQEAPIVIYSMTTSSHADAPRGMEFLYSANRLNVATSRPRCVCILVGSPLLFEAECRTPQQMRLVNAFCRYLEMAEKV
jgi:predicted RecB family nuclease